MNVIGDLQTQADGVSVGNITVTGPTAKVTSPKFCLNADCITAWPVGGGGGGDITDVLTGLGLTGGGSTGAVTVNLDTAYTDSKYVQRKGDTMTGLLTLSGDPTLALQAATKQYVDNAVAGGGGGGDVTGVTAGTGISILTPNGPIPNVSFDQTYGDGRYVNVTGDTMTGNLTVNGASNAVNITSSAGSALLANGVTYGGAFSGSQAGVDSVGSLSGIIGRTSAVGVGTAVRGYGGLIGANLAGTETGVVTKGGTYGVRIESTPSFGFYTTSSLTDGVHAIGNTSGGYFENGTNSNYKAWVAYNGYGLYVTTPLASDFGLYTNGKIQVGGDIIAGGNTLASCAWTAYVADGVAMTCPAANPLMSGIQRSGTNMRMYCCDL